MSSIPELAPSLASQAATKGVSLLHFAFAIARTRRRSVQTHPLSALAAPSLTPTAAAVARCWLGAGQRRITHRQNKRLMYSRLQLLPLALAKLYFNRRARLAAPIFSLIYRPRRAPRLFILPRWPSGRPLPARDASNLCPPAHPIHPSGPRRREIQPLPSPGSGSFLLVAFFPPRARV